MEVKQMTFMPPKMPNYDDFEHPMTDAVKETGGQIQELRNELAKEREERERADHENIKIAKSSRLWGMIGGISGAIAVIIALISLFF